MKIALVCSGIGRVQRGFERLVTDLFGILRHDLDITLFKGGGEAGDHEQVVWNLHRHGHLNRALSPLHVLTRRNAYQFECLSFALALAPRLAVGRFDLVHFIDQPMGPVLHRLRQVLPRKYRLLYTHGAVMDTRYYPRFDHAHQIAWTLHQAALDSGIPADRLTLLPCGIHAERFTATATRDELRARYGIPRDLFVVLSVAAINRTQKRLDHVIEEVAGLGEGFLLWMDGNLEDPGIRDLAERRLGSGFRMTHVPSADVRDLYGLADLFVLGSFEESFGLAVVEAMVSGLPVVTHSSPHFEWLVENPACLVDMACPGRLRERIALLAGNAAALRDISERNTESARRRFDWVGLKSGYLDLYHRSARHACS